MHAPQIRRLLFAAALAALTAFAAGCGAEARSPAVASVGATSSTTAAVASPTQGGASGHSYGAVLAYSECMRAHGLPDFPDPDSKGGLLVDVHPGSDLIPSSPHFQSASKACRRLLPNGGQETPAQQEQDLARFLAYARCMRSHGVRDFPDPALSNGGVSLIERGGGLDQSSPQFQNAQRACRSLSPGG